VSQPKLIRGATVALSIAVLAVVAYLGGTRRHNHSVVAPQAIAVHSVPRSASVSGHGSATSSPPQLHYLPRGHQIVRWAVSIGILAAGVLTATSILSTSGGPYDSYEVAGVALAGAVISPAALGLRRYKRDVFFFVSYASGLLSLVAAWLTMSNDSGLNGLIVGLTLGAAGASILALIGEALGKGESVWVWQGSEWPVTKYPWGN
jgi:hypothetical protein